VLYAQPLPRIASLATGDLHHRPGGTTVLSLDGNPVPIHEPIASLIEQLPARRRNGVTEQLESPWLFPGNHAARPITPNALGMPAEAEDRAVPGHWEGDLLYGHGPGVVATLVERHSRFVMLVGLPETHRADVVAAALAAKITELPKQLRRSLTWDQGREMAQHSTFSVDSGVPRVLLRSPQPLATRQQREHQRAAAPLPPAQVPLG
jgi:hypothetical protein